MNLLERWRLRRGRPLRTLSGGAVEEWACSSWDQEGSRCAHRESPRCAQTIVETGTYLGHTTAYLAARGFNVHTIELSPELAERAQSPLPRDGQRPRLARR